MTTNSRTNEGTRTFDNVITVTWTPAFFDPSVLVTINSGGSILKYMTFTNTSTQEFDVEQGSTISISGIFAAVFNAGGLHGTLTANTFEWDINGQKGSYKGDIGIW